MKKGEGKMVKTHRSISTFEHRAESLERLSENFAVLLNWLLNYCHEQNIPITTEQTPKRLLNLILKEVKELNLDINPDFYLKTPSRRKVTDFRTDEDFTECDFI